MGKTTSNFLKIIFMFFLIFSVHYLFPKNVGINLKDLKHIKDVSMRKSEPIMSFCTLDRIVDGDTIWVRCYKGFKANETFKVRFADINAPEIETSPGKESKAFLERFFRSHSRKILLCVDTKKIYGKYHRVVAVVLIPINNSCYLNLNKFLVDKGYAEPVDYYNSFHPWQWRYETICGKALCVFNS